MLANIEVLAASGSIYLEVAGPNWSWREAQARAQELGGNLATINSREENDLLESYFHYYTPLDNIRDDFSVTNPSETWAGHWIGFTDTEQEGSWEWISGEDVSFTNWGSIQPDNNYSSSGGQDFAILMHQDQVGKWDDLTNTDRAYAGIAEIPFLQYGESAYVVVNGPTWQEAEANAVALGGHLVSINDQDENEWIYSQYYTEGEDEYYTEGEDALHIGLYEVSDGTYQWISGQSASYTNWSAHEPNGGTDGVATQFGHIYTHSGQWNDHPDSPLKGLAEIPLASLYKPAQPDSTKAPVRVEQLVLEHSLYRIVDGPSWDVSEYNATMLGGHLVSIESDREQEWLYRNFLAENKLSPFIPISSSEPDWREWPSFWIGLTDKEVEGQWQWSSGVNLGYEAWAEGEPDDNWGGQDYAMLGWQWANSWSDNGNISSDGFNEGAKGIAEIPFIRRGGSAYVVVEGPTWEDAQANAKSLGGSLVIIDDQAENDWIYDTYRSLGRSGFANKSSNPVEDDTFAVWIGLTDRFQEGVWLTPYGDTAPFLNWDSKSEPNNATWYDSDGEDYASMIFLDQKYIDSGRVGGLWGDLGTYSQNADQAFSGIAEIHLFDLEITYSFADLLGNTLTQQAILGDSVDLSARYNLEITAESLREGYDIESADVTISFDSSLFNDISASDIRIGGELPIANSVHIDNDAGAIRIAAASLSSLASGNGITSETVLASISLDFDETALAGVNTNPDGSFTTNPLSFAITANADETVFSRSFTDSSGQLNREILTLANLGGYTAVEGQDVTLYEAKINLKQQGDGLVLGTERVIGADAAFTNLIRSGDTLTTSVDWLNVGNIQANNLSYTEVYNQHATLNTATFSKSSVASGSFIDGIFVEDARESTTLTAEIKVTGQAGNVLDLADGIISIKADGSDVFANTGKGSSNLITFQGDLNYDGSVSMKDLAYLNAGAARQQATAENPAGLDADGNGFIDATVARDVDADFNGKIDLADLAILDADWGKTLHIGDEQFQGSADISWNELDSQGAGSSWDNASFKDQNAVEADASYVGSLESPTTTGVIGADGNTNANDGDMQGAYFQDPLMVA